MRVYDIDREKKEYNTECGIFKEGDQVQVTLFDASFPTKYQILNVSEDGGHAFFLFHNEETGDIITQADVEIDYMIKVG